MTGVVVTVPAELVNTAWYILPFWSPVGVKIRLLPVCAGNIVVGIAAVGAHLPLDGGSRIAGSGGVEVDRAAEVDRLIGGAGRECWSGLYGQRGGRRDDRVDGVAEDDPILRAVLRSRARKAQRPAGGPRDILPAGARVDLPLDGRRRIAIAHAVPDSKGRRGARGDRHVLGRIVQVHRQQDSQTDGRRKLGDAIGDHGRILITVFARQSA